MRVFIAEKPELAKAIVEGLGGGKRLDGYYDCGSDVVTWCYGHMLTLKDPEDYDEQYSRWSMDHLPMSFIPWEYKPGEDKKTQLKVIADLLKKSTSCVNSADADAEGQLLVDEILKYFGYTKPVQRVLINDNNLKPVQRALANLQPNSNFYGLSQAAEARSVGDQLYGYNMTRAYTLAARQAGYQGVLSVGRVQTPVLGLVVRRDLEHEAHTKSYFYTITGQFDIAGQQFPARYQVKDSDPVDDKGRILDQVFANELAKVCDGQAASILSAKTTNKQQAAPLPYNLLKLQTDASRKFGFKPDQVKDITQALREKYKLITYNRSDCQYLSDDHHADAPGVLAAISQTAPVLAGAAKSAKPSIKSKAFNSDKVTAHHAIIPTEATADFSRLTDAEQKIYMLIARAYIAQFWPNHEYKQTDIVVECAGNQFAVRSNVTTSLGWKLLYKNDAGNDEVDAEEDALTIDLAALRQGNAGQCTACNVEQKETKPPARYTMATLLTDLTRVAKYVRDPKLKALLIEKDKDKAGEHGGIGTPATRDSIIKGLFERGFLLEQGKNIVSSPVAREYYNILPDQAKYPDMTAIWHDQQQSIEQGKLDCLGFIHSLMEYIGEQVSTVKEQGITGMKIQVTPCPLCGKPLRRVKGSKGFFWGCTGFTEGCKGAFDDKGGKPILVKKEALLPSQKHKCMSCGKGLIRRAGKKPKTFFWGCSGYPECNQSYPDAMGKPNYSKPKV